MTDTWQRPPDGVHAGWRYTIRITDLLVEDPAPAQLKAICTGVADRLREARDFTAQGPKGDELRDIEDVFRDAVSINEFDGVLSELYDWADTFRVIIR